MRKVLVLSLVFLSIISILINFGYQPLIAALGLTPKAGIRVTSDQKAKVLVDNKEVGNTPYQDENLKEGEYLVVLKNDPEGSESGKILWQGYAKLYGGTLTVINRDLADNPSTSSGETITLEKGGGATIVSTPPQAEVVVDNKVAGRTPVTIDSLAAGEHQFMISKNSYLKRNIKATAVDGYNLTLTVDLAISEPDLTKLPTIPVTTSVEVVVKKTPTGFLRVRKSPSLDGEEIARVSPGDSLVLLEEIANWDRVRLVDGKEGYVSSIFVGKKTASPTPNAAGASSSLSP